MTTTPTAKRRQQLEAALVDAAEGIIAQRGLVALRARDLAAQAGCALGAIYTAFPDLDAIVIAVNMRTLALLDQHLRAVAEETSKRTEMNSEDPAIALLVRLALGYLEFAAKHGPRWRALFDHRLPEGQAVPAWYLSEQNRIFMFVEEPLHILRPDLTAAELAQLARVLFSTVHGIVSLGLEQKLGETPLRRLREQTALLVAATARGLREPVPGNAKAAPAH